MATIQEMTNATGVTIVTGHENDLEIPVLAGMQRQGDVIVIPASVIPASVTATTEVTNSGTPVVQGENGGNTHAIFADGPVFCDTYTPSVRELRVATLTVPEGSTAYLGHPEHGFNGIAPGNYEIRRQREMAEEMRMIAD